ncbi:MAG: metal-dependent hydrolase [Candidatus Aenigmarchaeota archaeon]|nr:metal-dependent hydrolase [Candidatus Aenigmarchaeota archaeon]
MDSFTHALLPFLLAASMKKSRAFSAAVFLGALSPDFDVIISWIGYILNIEILSHRGITHTLLFGFFTAAIVLYIFSRKKIHGFFEKLIRRHFELEFSPLMLAAAYVGVLSHLFLDALTTRGIPLLYPLSAKRYSFELFFYIDVFLMVFGVLIAGYVFLKRNNIVMDTAFARKMFVMYFVFFAALTGLRIYEKGIAYDAIDAPDKKAYASPNPFVWSVVGIDDATISLYSYDALKKNITSFHSIPRSVIFSNGATFSIEDALLKARGLKRVRDFELNARAVAIEAYFDGTTDEWIIEFFDAAGGVEFSGMDGAPRHFFSVTARISE